MLSRLALVPLVLVGCGDDGGTAKPVDAPPHTVDVDNASCGDQVNFTGELLDWDASDANFCGIGDAEFVVRGDGGMDRTAPNGRFELCIPNAAATVVNVTPPTAASPCTVPISSYTMPGIVVANRAVIQSGAKFSARMFTSARQTSFFNDSGVTFNAAKAQLLVHFAGSPHQVSIAAAHDAVQAMTTTTTWAPGNTGTDVVFPNVDVGGGTTDVLAGGVLGQGTVTIAAGTLTMVTLAN